MKIRRILLTLSMLLLASTFFEPIYANATIDNRKSIILKIDDPWMYVNDHVVELDPGFGTTPVIRDGRTLLPIKSITDELGGSVKWEAKEKKVSMNLNNNNINLWIDKKTASVNGKQIVLDVAPIIINGRTMVPLRFVSENLGLTLVWDKPNQIIALHYGNFDYIPNDYSDYFAYENIDFKQDSNEKTKETEPYDSNGKLIYVHDIVSVGMFSGTVKETNGSKILVYWDSKSIFVPNGDEEFWALVSGIKYKSNQWLEAREVTIESSRY